MAYTYFDRQCEAQADHELRRRQMADPGFDALDPLAPLREFDVEPFHIVVRQRVTGGLEYLVCAGGKVLVVVPLPVGYDVDDAETEARETFTRYWR